jgi:hypothetical protein
MVRLATRLFLAPALLAALAASAHAQTAAPAAPAPSPVLSAPAAESPAPSAPRRNRAISGDVAAALAAATPKYTPPPPKPPPKPEEELVDMREVDKPKNTIVRLPKYIVQEKKPAVFRERDVHTQKGLTEIAMRRYISEADRAMNRWTLPLFGISAEARALAMYAEDERLRNMSDLDDAATNASKSNAAAGSYIRKETDKTFLRSSDFGWNGGGPR